MLASTPSDNNQQTDPNKSFFSSPPTVSLPKGGGAIKGMGEKFTANPVTGTGSMSVPIATSPGRSGFGPQLSLSYDSGAGNGIFGMGWSLSLPSITRKTDKGLPRYWDSEESDVFLLSGAEDLVPVRSAFNSPDGQFKIERYRPRIEGLFARIERWTNIADPGDVHWRSISKDNILTLYGKDTNSRIADPEDSRRIFSWLICETRDDKGNAVLYEYKPEDGAQVDLTQANERNRGDRDDLRCKTNRYLKRVYYGNRVPLLDGTGQRPQFLTNAEIDNAGWMFEVVFDYGEHGNLTPDKPEVWSVRHDSFSSYRAGFEVRTYRLCRRVLMFHHIPNLPNSEGYEGLVRSTDFTYSHDRDRIYTFLHSVTQTGYRRNSENSYSPKKLPPLEFTYSEPLIDETVHEVDPRSLENLPEGLDGARYQWVDLDGEGVSGILTEQEGGWFYKRNLSPINRVQSDGIEGIEARFAPVELVASKPAIALANGAQFLDLAGDGQPDLVSLRGTTPGFYERTRDAKGWESFVSFKSLPVLDWDNPNLKFIDLDGDGHSDILITEDECFVWHPSLAEDGFGAAEQVRQSWDEEKGPRVVFADGTQSIHLADMSGDGLTDIVRIRNGEVCYWPNLGYGRFGAKVTMDNAPWFDAPDIFDQRRIQLADIDGSGTTDILYLSGEGVQVYFNLSGNGWAGGQVLRNFPAIDSLSSVTVVDLLGNGTACLVWSSPLPGNTGRAMRYVELMGGEQRIEQIDGTELRLRSQKPHLLIRTINNLGAETIVQYAPSTKFYLQDWLAGKPWITKLPFPVQVVEKVTVIDKWRQTKFTNTYSYHHGYFDGIEREFRGFGRVEQTDDEDFGTFAAKNAASPYITNDLTLYQPPVKTITWFHTGAFLDRDRVLNQFQSEYFAPRTNQFAENQLPEPDLTSLNLSAEEWREALRACKGMMLRQEIYELNVNALARGEEERVKLFSTAFHNCHIQRLQPRGDNRHAVFLVTESEAITYHYELGLRSQSVPSGEPPTLQPDPRIAHTLNLRIDEYGNVLQSVAVTYPRIGRFEAPDLREDGTEDLIRNVQQERHLVYTENRFTNDAIALNHYRLRLPCEVKTYELTGITLNSGKYFTLAERREIAIADTVPDRTAPQKRLVEWVRMLYFSDDLENPLPFGKLNALALPYETYKLALTDDLLTVFSDRLTPEIRQNLENADLSGYLSGSPLGDRFPDLNITGQYWIRSGIAGFGERPRDRFYLPDRYTDSFGNTTTLDYDAPYYLFPRSTTDPVGNRTEILRFNYRVLAAEEIRDPNLNHSEVAFDVLGMPAAMAVKGKGDEGDSLSDVLLDIEGDRLTRFFTRNYDEAEARQLLGNATARYLYYFGEQPGVGGNLRYGSHSTCAAGLVREMHVVQGGAASPLQAGFEYSDGMGTVLVKKVQAEPENTSEPMQWIATGKTILNNKGKPVKQYEPYFSTNDRGEPNHRFEEPREEGVTSILYYDAAGRQIRTEMPDGTYSQVEFSPWFMATWDAIDTVEPGNEWYVRRTDPTHPDFVNFGTAENRRAARLAEIHASTPAVTHLDSLGREVVAIAHNKWQRDSVTTEEKYVTYTKLDIEGKPLWIRDARGNRVMEYINRPGAETDYVPCYDIAGNLLFQHSMDGSDRWMLMDAAGKPFYAWDENRRVLEDGSLTPPEQRVFHTTYDQLRRPVAQELQVSGIDGRSRYLIERFIYGESHPQAQERNLRGQVYQHYDPSGLITNEWFDFKGNLLETRRKLTQTYNQAIVDWNIETPSTETFTQRTQYDALNRMIRQENWHRADRRDRPPAIYTPRYNQRGVLVSETLTVRGQVTEAILKIEYDAKGQRTRIQYGNGTTTRYHYDPETFRLVQLRTTRTSPGERLPTLPSNLSNLNVLQNLYYTYDPVGNITEIHDDAYEPVFFNNQRVEPRNTYTYDALYRLIKATGRENYHVIEAPDRLENPAFTVSFPVTDQALRNYAQAYTYDSVGNILEMRHVADRGSWTRQYVYASDSNRLSRTWKGGDPVNAVVYDYDTHGSMLNLANTLDVYRLRWDYRDMIYTANLGGGGQAFYNYDAEKQRVRKRIESNSSTIKERLYLGGMELYRHWVGNTLVEEIEAHHLFADDQRVLIVEDVLSTNNPNLDAGTLYRYQYGNHLGSVSLEMTEGDDPQVISYEEYHPYGTTAYQGTNRVIKAKAKRYRYTGMERDEETGLNYHTARYYLPWLGRWCSADPLGIKATSNTYEYCRNQPVSLRDPDGKQPGLSPVSPILPPRLLPLSPPVVPPPSPPIAPPPTPPPGTPTVSPTPPIGTGVRVSLGGVLGAVGTFLIITLWSNNAGGYEYYDPVTHEGVTFGSQEELDRYLLEQQRRTARGANDPSETRIAPGTSDPNVPALFPGSNDSSIPVIAPGANTSEPRIAPPRVGTPDRVEAPSASNPEAVAEFTTPDTSSDVSSTREQGGTEFLRPEHLRETQRWSEARRLEREIDERIDRWQLESELDARLRSWEQAAELERDVEAAISEINHPILNRLHRMEAFSGGRLSTYLEMARERFGESPPGLNDLIAFILQAATEEWSRRRR